MNQQVSIDMTAREISEARYEELLKRAQSEDLREVSGIGFLYQSGYDRLGRPVIVLCGKWFPVNQVDLEKVTLYVINLLDSIVENDYVLIYFHTRVATGNIPPLAWIKELYYMLTYKYKKNLKALYIVHPTMLAKIMTWWFSSFLAPAIKKKLFTIEGIEHLYAVVARDQLEIPAYINEYDMTVNGLHYVDYSSPETARIVGDY